MAKSKPKKSKKGRSGGFFARIFDIFTALIIIAVIGAAVWYWFFYSERKGGHSIKESIKGLYEKESGSEANEKDKKAEKQAQPSIDENADDEYMESVDSDIISGEDAIANQYEEELVSNYSSSDTGSQNYSSEGFYRSVNNWASKYKGLKVKSNADPDVDNATDNSHLICSIWKHAANENGRKFKGYIPSDKILDNLDRVGKDEFRSGDLMVLEDGMFGMVINYKNPDNYELIYASGEKNKVVIIDLPTMKNYWLTPKKFKGYYRAEKEVLN